MTDADLKEMYKLDLLKSNKYSSEYYHLIEETSNSIDLQTETTEVDYMKYPIACNINLTFYAQNDCTNDGDCYLILKTKPIDADAYTSEKLNIKYIKEDSQANWRAFKVKKDITFKE